MIECIGFLRMELCSALKMMFNVMSESLGVERELFERVVVLTVP